MEIIYKKVQDLIPYVNNSRTHSEEQVNQICASINEFGFTNPLLIDEKDSIIAGHGRLMASKKLGMEEVPCIVLEGLTEAQKKAYIIADNKMALNAGWDEELLKIELENLKELDFNLDLTGFNVDELDDIFQVEEEREIVEDDFDIEPPEEPKAKLGDIYQLGNHRLMCGDSTKQEDVDKLMNGVKADLVFTDPPYGMKKENDGVANDNLNYDDLLEFNKKWIPITFKELKDNGSWYCWGIDEPLMDIYSNILKPMQKQNKITFRNLITWKKENDNPTMIFNGACSSNNRSYYTNEKCLFVMAGVQGFNNNSENYYEGWEPIRCYLENEAQKVGLTAKKLQEICGVGMYAHWFTKSQFTLIPKEHYLKLQEYYKGKAFTKPYDNADSIKKEYQKLKDEYYKTRAYFDGTKYQCIDVWVNDVTRGKEKESAGGHATPKPIAICTRAIETSSRENENVLDVFGGSGSTLIACEQLNRNCYMMELNEHYVSVIIERYINFTGNDVYRLNPDGTKTNWRDIECEKEK